LSQLSAETKVIRVVSVIGSEMDDTMFRHDQGLTAHMDRLHESNARQVLEQISQRDIAMIVYRAADIVLGANDVNEWLVTKERVVWHDTTS
jgi:hypothetical protein